MRRASVRQTRADYSMGLNNSNVGLGPVARRGWDDYTAKLIALAETKGSTGLRHFYQTAPLRMLRVLLEVHPMAKMAHSNNAADVCLPDSTRIVAGRNVTKTNATTGQNENSFEIDSVETSKLEEFLNRYPGGLPGMQRALLKQLEWAGRYVIEAIPAKRGEGVLRGVTVDPLTILDYPREDGGWEHRQMTSGEWAQSRGFGSSANEIVLDPDTTFLLALDYEDDNPAGVPWFGGALQELLKDLGQERNLTDILRGWAYAHTYFGFPVEETLELVRKNPKLLEGRGPDGEDITEEEYLDQEFAKFCDYLATINPDDPIVVPKGTEGKVLESGAGISALDGMAKMRRHRIVMGLDQMPNRVGITEGGTQAYAKEQSRQDGRKLEFARWIINSGPVWLCQLHLRLQGKDLIARSATESIIPGERLTDANARKIEVDTDYVLVDRGAMDPEAVAMKHTGSGSHDPSRAYNKPEKTAEPTPDPAETDPPPTDPEPGEEDKDEE